MRSISHPAVSELPSSGVDGFQSPEGTAEAPDFDRQRFVATLRDAVAIADDVRSLMKKLLREGVERLYFMGTGGTQLLALPAAELAQRYSLFPVGGQAPAQVVVDPPVGLDGRALAILPSLSGTTKESLDALSFLRRRGVRSLSLTGHRDTPLAQEADHNFTVFAESDAVSESFYLQTVLIVLALLAEREEYDEYEATVSEFTLLPELLADAKAAFDGAAAQLARKIGNESFHIITGAGPVWSEAAYFGMCVLEEMQWIRTRPVHAADFFHGTLELIEPGVSVFVLKGEDPSRTLADRVEAFVKRYTDHVWVLDAASVEMPGISPQVRALISPIVLATLLERLSAHLALLRNHPLTTRRYYKRVEY